MPRKILHLDLDAFFCAVEELRDPNLSGKAFAVGGRPDARGVVASCSYPARMFGVRSAMPMSRAVRICPGLIIVPGSHGVYGSYSQQVMERLAQLTPLIEQVSIDEAFLDVSDLPESGPALAERLQAQIRSELSLPCSLGVATNKLVAKIACDAGKAMRRKATGGKEPPNAITVVPPGEEAAFLAPLPAEALWGVGPKTAQTLEEMRIHTIGDLARAPEALLNAHFGKNGADMLRHARGIDDSPVVTSHVVKSISQETTFERDVRDRDVLLATLREQAESVGRRLREDHLCGATVKIKLRWSDFTTITRQLTLPQPTDTDSVIYENARSLFEGEWSMGRPVRLVGVGVSGLAPAMRQLSLWDTASEKEHRLLEAVDDLRRRYGERIIHRGKTSRGQR